MNEQEKQEYGRQMVALLSKLTEADGDLSTMEKRWLRALINELPSAKGEDLPASVDFDPERLRALVAEEGDAEELIEFLLLVSLADGQTSSSEWALIGDIANLVGISPERLEKMRETTVLVEPG